jgi:hypothetical protein
MMLRGAPVLLLAAIAVLPGCVVVTTVGAVGGAAVAVGSAAVSLGASAVGAAVDITVGAAKAVGSAVAPSSKDETRPDVEAEPK